MAHRSLEAGRPEGSSLQRIGNGRTRAVASVPVDRRVQRGTGIQTLADHGRQCDAVSGGGILTHAVRMSQTCVGPHVLIEKAGCQLVSPNREWWRMRAPFDSLVVSAARLATSMSESTPGRASAM